MAYGQVWRLPGLPVSLISPLPCPALLQDDVVDMILVDRNALLNACPSSALPSPAVSLLPFLFPSCRPFPSPSHYPCPATG